MPSAKLCNAQSFTRYFIKSFAFFKKSRSISAKSEIKVFYIDKIMSVSKTMKASTLRDNHCHADVTVSIAVAIVLRNRNSECR